MVPPLPLLKYTPSLAEQLHKIGLYAISEGYAGLDADCLQKLSKLNARQNRAIAHVYRYNCWRGEGMPMSLLANALHMSASAASHMVGSMEKKNLLVRRTAENDRRSVLVSVHASYIPYAEAMAKGISAAVDYLKEPLTEEELAMFSRCVQIMYNRTLEPFEGTPADAPLPE